MEPLSGFTPFLQAESDEASSPLRPQHSLLNRREKPMRELLQLPIHQDRGASMVEYALLVVLIAVVAIVAVNVVGPAVSGGYSSAASGLAN